ncbi:hypothetical protein [Nocardiopsis synnemataformans]|uniref:hypothetical protein n=1 Tax=Nocardiopsis synnemataformans TaxID=61305 RepID=UPI003EC0B578
MAALDDTLRYLETHPWSAENLEAFERVGSGLAAPDGLEEMARLGLIASRTDQTVTAFGREVLRAWQPYRELVNSRAGGGYGIPANYASAPDGLPEEDTSVPAGKVIAQVLAAGGLLLADLPPEYAPSDDDDLTVPDPAVADSTGYVVMAYQMEGDAPNWHMAEVLYLDQGRATGPGGEPWHARLWSAARVLDASGAQIQYRTMQSVTARCYVTAAD